MECGFLLAEIVPGGAVAQCNVEGSENYSRGVIRRGLSRVVCDLVYFDCQSRKNRGCGFDEWEEEDSLYGRKCRGDLPCYQVAVLFVGQPTPSQPTDRLWGGGLIIPSSCGGWGVGGSLPHECTQLRAPCVHRRDAPGPHSYALHVNLPQIGPAVPNQQVCKRNPLLGENLVALGFNVGGCEREKLVAEGDHEVVLEDGVGGEEETVAEELRVIVDPCVVDGGEEFREEGCLARGSHFCGWWWWWW